METKVKNKRQDHSLPPMTLEARENQLISMAMDAAEAKLRDGTATSQIIIHFLKLGTTIAELQKAKLENENLLLVAKSNAIAAADRSDKLLEDAVNAMTTYRSYNEEPQDGYDPNDVVYEEHY